MLHTACVAARLSGGLKFTWTRGPENALAAARVGILSCGGTGSVVATKNMYNKIQEEVIIWKSQRSILLICVRLPI